MDTDAQLLFLELGMWVTAYLSAFRPEAVWKEASERLEGRHEFLQLVCKKQPLWLCCCLGWGEATIAALQGLVASDWVLACFSLLSCSIGVQNLFGLVGQIFYLLPHHRAVLIDR